MDPLAKVVRDRMQALTPPQVHPDPNLLAAFSENALRDAERAQVLDHLAACSSCREIVAVSLPEEQEAAVYVAAAMAATPAVPAAAQASWLRPRLILRWGALAACVIVGVAVIVQRQTQKTASEPAAYSPPTLTAELKANEETRAVSAAKSGDVDAIPAAEPKDSRQSEARKEMAAKPLAPPERELNRLVAKAKRAAPTAAPPAAAFGNVGRGLGAGSLSNSTRAAAPPPVIDSITAGTANYGVADKVAQGPIESSPGNNKPTSSATPEREAADAKTALAKVEEDSELAKKQQAQANDAAVSAQTKAGYLTGQKSRLRSGVRFPSTRWTLSPNGQVLRSLDLGESWHPVEIQPGITFLALSGAGREVWAGGRGGVLYHTTDNGEHWISVKPVAGGQPLSGDIVHLEFHDTAHGTLTTANHEVWTTSDGGANWQKN